MSALAEYLHMGGYALFVWPAYALGLAGLIGVLWQSVAAWQAREREFGALKSARGRDAGDGS
jgi:heme exporter protein D